MADISIPAGGVQLGGGYGQYGGNLELHGAVHTWLVGTQGFGALVSPVASAGLDLAVGAKTEGYGTVGGEAVFITPLAYAFILPTVGVEAGVKSSCSGPLFMAKPSVGIQVPIPVSILPLLSVGAAFTPQMTEKGMSSGGSVSLRLSF